MTKRYLLLLSLSVWCAAMLCAQDIHFTQYGMSPLTQSPAMAGIGHDLRAILQYRNQWASVTTPFKTTAFSYDMQLKKKKGKSGFLAAGVNFFTDNAGDSKFKSTQGGLSLAYHVRTGENSTIGAGLFGGFGQRSIDPSSLQWNEQYQNGSFNGQLPTGETITSSSFSFVDLGLGGVWHYNSKAGANDVVSNQSTQATLGFGFFHVTQPTYTFLGADEKLYSKMVIHGNARFALGEGNTAILPSFQYTKQGPSTELMLGAMFRYVLTPTSKITGINKGSALSLGGFLRTKDAIAIAALFEQGRLAFGLSYDLNTSDLRAASNGNGAFEIAVRFVSPSPFRGTSKGRD
jgi:type IX secretion system PorP/SprF family membrane protein